MKKIKKGTLCQKCLGCTKLLIENFTGSYKCDNFMKGVEDNARRIINNSKINERFY